MREFLSKLFSDLLRETFKVLLSFAVGTAGGAVICWYYGFPLILSLFGGILVVAFMLALIMGSNS